MATRDELLDKVKDLMAAARDLSASPPNPFSAVSGTPALDALKLNGSVLSDADLSKLLAEVEKAKSDDDTWKKVAATVGGLLGGLAKGILALLVVLGLAACSTPPPIQRASLIEGQAMAAFKSDHDLIVLALFSDLALALETQIQLIENYEIKSKGAAVSQADLSLLLEQGRKKRAEIAAKLDALRAKVKTADKNYEIAVQIHQSIATFLDRPAFDMSDVSGLIGDVVALKSGQLPAGK